MSEPFNLLRFNQYKTDLWWALIDLSRETMKFDLQKISKENLIKELDKGDVAAGTHNRTEKWVGDQVLEVNWPLSTPQTENIKVTVTVMAPLDRLKGKFLQARGVAQRVATNMEAEADSLIAQEDSMKAKTTSAFAPHKAILAEASSELKAIEDALNLMSNGGPALDPLHDAEPTAADSKPGA